MNQSHKGATDLVFTKGGGPMGTSAYWMAVCQHVTCDWELLTGSETTAEEGKRLHEGDYPEHAVDVLEPGDQAQYWLIPPAA